MVAVPFYPFALHKIFLLRARSTADVPVAKWTRRRFPEPKIVGSSPTWDVGFVLELRGGALTASRFVIPTLVA